MLARFQAGHNHLDWNTNFMLTILFERFICGWNGSSTKWNKNKHCVQYFHVLQTNARRKNWQQTNDENCQFDDCGLWSMFLKTDYRQRNLILYSTCCIVKQNHFVKSIFYCQLYKTYQIKFDSFAERGEIKFILIANYSSQLEWSEAMA